MRVFSSRATLLSGFLYSNLYSFAYAQSLDQALRANNLTLFADFFIAYPPDPFLFNRPDLIVYASTNSAMQVYLDAHGITLGKQIPKNVLRREDDDYKDDGKANADANNHLGQGKGDFMSQGASIFGTGENETKDNKVLEHNDDDDNNNDDDNYDDKKRALEARALQERPPPMSWLAKIYSGNAHLSYITENKILFDGGVFYTMDSFFQLAMGFKRSIFESGFCALQAALNRIPDILTLLQNSKEVTLLAPSPEAFEAAGINKLSDTELRSLFEYHTIINSGFIGYTPALKNATTYKTKSGLSFLVTYKGNTIYINDAKIVARNQILRNGVIQVIDKFLVPPLPGATTLPGPDGPVLISEITTEGGNPISLYASGIPTPQPAPTDIGAPQPTPADIETPHPAPTDIGTPYPAPTDIGGVSSATSQAPPVSLVGNPSVTTCQPTPGLRFLLM